jgi:signal transduction histidine kinase
MMSTTRPASAAPSLGPAQLARAFPFFLHVDAQLVIQSVGPSLRKAMRALHPGVRLGALFNAERPLDASDATVWAQHQRELVTLSAFVGAPLNLRGSYEAMDDGGWLLLVCPVFHGVGDMAALGLELSDIAPHDSAADLLLARRTAELSLDDARRLAGRLRSRTHQLETILELSTGGVLHFDPSNTLLHCNEALESILEMPRDELIGRTLVQVDEVLSACLTPRDRRRSVLQQLAAADQGDHPSATVQIRLPVQKVVQVSTRLSAEGDRVFYLLDVTHESEVDRMKSDFLSTAAHELRTPMVSVYGFSELLLKREFAPERQREMLETIHRQSGVLVHLVNELLDLSRIEARRGQDFVMLEQPLMPLVDRAVDGLMVPGDARRVQIIDACADAFPGRPVQVSVDAEKLGLALTNVLSNAYKYSPEGGDIRVVVAPATLGPEPAVAVEVIDHGLGMAPEQLERLFERFWRADPSGQIPGTGLGMCLVKEIIELHGGRVDVESAKGIGTRVTLRLPCVVIQIPEVELIPVAIVVDD